MKNEKEILNCLNHLKHHIPPEAHADKHSHDLMFLHSQILNVVFNKILQAASLERNAAFDMEKIKSALQSQRQCRHAIESMGRIRIRQNRANKLKESKNAY